MADTGYRHHESARSGRSGDCGCSRSRSWRGSDDRRDYRDRQRARSRHRSGSTERTREDSQSRERGRKADRSDRHRRDRRHQRSSESMHDRRHSPAHGGNKGRKRTQSTDRVHTRRTSNKRPRSDRRNDNSRVKERNRSARARPMLQRSSRNCCSDSEWEVSSASSRSSFSSVSSEGTYHPPQIASYRTIIEAAQRSMESIRYVLARDMYEIVREEQHRRRYMEVDYPDGQQAAVI